MIKIKIKKNKVKTGSPIRQDVIRVFINAINIKDPSVLYDDLNSAGIIPVKAIRMLDRESVDPQFYLNACHMHNEMIKLLGYGEEMKIDAFADFPKADSDEHRTPDKYWMRSPRLPSSTAQLDYRRGEKTLAR
jgi:hypothetical protein